MQTKWQHSCWLRSKTYSAFCSVCIYRCVMSIIKVLINCCDTKQVLRLVRQSWFCQKKINLQDEISLLLLLWSKYRNHKFKSITLESNGWVKDLLEHIRNFKLIWTNKYLFMAVCAIPTLSLYVTIWYLRYQNNNFVLLLLIITVLVFVLFVCFFEKV